MPGGSAQRNVADRPASTHARSGERTLAPADHSLTITPTWQVPTMVLFMTRITPRGGMLAKRLDGYQELVTEYNEAKDD
jgi:hypothetical protein